MLFNTIHGMLFFVKYLIFAKTVKKKIDELSQDITTRLDKFEEQLLIDYNRSIIYMYPKLVEIIEKSNM